jgi:hypothetical protein
MIGDFQHFIVFWHDGSNYPDSIVGLDHMAHVGDIFDALTHFTSTVAPSLGLKNEECRMVQMDRNTVLKMWFGGEENVSGN